MGFVGNVNGPRKSVVVAKLGHDYFSISSEELTLEMEDYKNDEFRGVVDPVYLDEHGRHYLRFYAPGGGTQRFYLGGERLPF